MYRDDKMFSIFLSLGNFSKKFLLAASSSSYVKYTLFIYLFIYLFSSKS